MHNKPVDTTQFYRDRFSGSLFVIKAGGRIITDEKSRTELLKTIKDFVSANIKVLLIYGGGHAIDSALKERDVATKKQNGRRITNAKAMPVIQSVMSADIAGQILSTMAKIDLDNGICLPAIPHSWTDIELRPRDKADYGFDGTLPKINASPVLNLLNAVPFIAMPSLATSKKNPVNVNADMAAVAFACWTLSRKLIFLSDVDGVMVDGNVASVLTDTDIHAHIKSGQIQGGMQVKMESCLDALDRGVRRIHLINGFKQGALAQEIYDPKGSGTMIVRDSDKMRYYEEIKLGEKS